ncbi:MAG: cysteine synthase A [Clostridia bacterium]|nr:cysteine synthase A [Clostridia bacterium]MBQ5833336.1 cysteine synthase A [Clostridia bacterium]
MLYHRIEDLIGNTPLLLAERYNRRYCPGARLLCKLESFNPTGSAKDRAALFMLAQAEKEGILQPESVLIEPTSGNTGIGLAALASARGYRLILTMPDTMSEERRRLLAAYGAEILLTPGKDGMQGAIEKANALAKEIPNAWIPSQFDNPANPEAHFCTTGPEILRDCGKDEPLIFVAGVGTGGTLSGVGRYLKTANPKTRVVAVEPKASPVLSGGASAPHGLQGIGANFVPENFDRSVCDEIFPVTEEEAYLAARRLAKSEGLLVGISSGAALHAATVITSRPENAGVTVVALLPDTGERYLSTPLFAN